MCYCLRPKPARPDGVMFFDFKTIPRLMTELSFLPSLQKTRHPTAGGNTTYRLTVSGQVENPATMIVKIEAEIIGVFTIEKDMIVKIHPFEINIRFDEETSQYLISISKREINYSSVGLKTLQRFAEAVDEAGQIDKPAKLEGRNMVMVLNPKQ